MLTCLTNAGIAGVANDDVSRSSHTNVQVSYPAYPTLQPITSNPPASSYNQYLPAPAQEHSYDSMQGYGAQAGQGTSYYQQPQAQQQSQTMPPQQQQQQYHQQQPSQDLYGSQGQSAYTQQLSQPVPSYQVCLEPD